MSSNRDTLNEAFRPTLHVGEVETSKWKKLSYIFFVICTIFLAGAAIFIFLYFSKDEDEKKEEDNSLPEVKWKPAGDRIKTQWGKNLDPDKVWQE